MYEKNWRRQEYLPDHESSYVLYCATHAVAHMHAVGLMHRDIKAGNIMVFPDGTPKLGMCVCYISMRMDGTFKPYSHSPPCHQPFSSPNLLKCIPHTAVLKYQHVVYSVSCAVYLLSSLTLSLQPGLQYYSYSYYYYYYYFFWGGERAVIYSHAQDMTVLLRVQPVLLDSPTTTSHKAPSNV